MKNPVSVEVRCTNRMHKMKPHLNITHIGGPNGDGTSWKMTIEKAIENIKSDTFRFYINHSGTKSGLVIARDSEGIEYLKTEMDKINPDTLLKLPQCE